MHHTHLDIGFTHTQEDVLELQMRHLDLALDLVDESSDYPPEAQFRWLPEGLWAVESWLAKASDEDRARFFAAVRAGRIGLDAFYGNALTGLYSGEELFALVDYAVRLRAEHDLVIDSAMISDVPGITWGTVSVLAHCGIRYLSTGPNPFHRTGWINVWDDKPFWWIGPDGESRILYWQAGKDGYAWFHGWRHPDNALENKLTERRIFAFLGELEAEEYPYDYVQLRYNIGQDNGPPDPHLAESVRQWNSKHMSPRFVIATTSQMFHAFEERYGDEIPEHSGDLTPYWEDGAASTAADTAANRRAVETLLQAQTLWALLNPAPYPAERFDAAWRNAVLYDEHTWGAYNAISEPDSEFARAQASRKQRFALDAEAQANALLAEATAGRRSDEEIVRAVDVINTTRDLREGFAVLSADWQTPGDVVRHGKTGDPVPSQRLASGELVFLTGWISALECVRFTIHPGESEFVGTAYAEETALGTDWYRIEIDPATGAIGKLEILDRGPENERPALDLAGEHGLNRYVYVRGRDPKAREGVSSVRITPVDRGPLVATMRIESDAPGTHELMSEIRVIDSLVGVRITNSIRKKAVREKEGVFFEFDFDVPEADVLIDQPWGAIRPELDQLEGAGKNYFAMQRWISVFGDGHRVTLVSPDAPLVQIGDIRTDEERPHNHPESWLTEIQASPRILSYVMNNYWETNYKADQEGPITIRYSLFFIWGSSRSRREYPGGYDPHVPIQHGLEVCQPLVVVPVDPDRSRPRRFYSPIILGTRPLMISMKPSRDGKATMMRFFGASRHGRPMHLRLWSDAEPLWTIYRSSPDEEAGEVVEGAIDLPFNGIVTLRLERAE